VQAKAHGVVHHVIAGSNAGEYLVHRALAVVFGYGRKAEGVAVGHGGSVAGRCAAAKGIA
jgi:hypothetical protein